MILRFILVIMLVWPSAAFSEWISVGDGIEYQAFTADGPNNLFVARMNRSSANAFIDTSIANNTMSGAREIVRDQAARQDDALTWWGGSWGARSKAVVAINGGFFNMTTGVIDGGQIQSAWYAHWFPNKGSFSGFAWKTDRTAFLGECVTHTAGNVYVKFVANGSTQAINGINQTPGSSDLLIFTPQYNLQTPTGSRTEVLVEMTRPNITTSGTTYSSGIIRSVTQNTGSTWIPFDHLVLSAGGSEGTTLKNNATVGAEIRIFQKLVETNEPDVQGTGACQSQTGADWSNVFAAINVNYHFLRDNEVRVPDADAHPGYIGYVNLNPRTAICWNANYVFFVICDGRTAQSVGMSCATLGYWAQSVLGATDGVNLDGGGSSTLVVNGAVMNNPSDGSERPVCNGVLMMNVQPKVQSTDFAAGQSVYTSGQADCRLGPGTNYGSIGTISAGESVTVLNHAIMGVYAKGDYWWKCNSGGTTGWVAQSLLTSSLGNVAPSITQQPQASGACIGGSATLTVAATGTSPLTFQWQKNQADLSNIGHCSGATSNALQISTADETDAANYRCVVSNAYGSATSDEAALTVTAGIPAPAAAPATDVGTDTITWNWSDVVGGTGFEVYDAATGGNLLRTLAAGAIAWTESPLDCNASYSRWITTANACAASARTPLGPTTTLPRTCPENAGFEQGFTSGQAYHWTNFNTAVLASVAGHTGSYAQAVQHDGGKSAAYRGIYQKYNLTPGAYYQFSGWMNNDSGSGTLLGVDPNGGIAGYTIRKETNTTTWGQRWCPIFQAGATGMVTLYLDSFRYTGTGSGYGYFDDIQISPGLTTVPANTLGCENQNVTFSVSATGGGAAITYQWQVSTDGGTSYSNISGATAASYSFITTAADIGKRFRCVVTGDGSACGGLVISPDGALTGFRATTRITAQPADAQLCPGANATFTASATGDGTLTYQWQKNQVNLSDDGHVAGATTGTLTLFGADSSDVGGYSCVITGGCGSVTSNAAMLSLEPAAIPDFNGDNSVDAADLDLFNNCLTAPGLPYDWQNPPPGCTLGPDSCGYIAADLDRDGDVDQDDFGILQRCYSGTNNPVDPNCAK